MLPEKLSNELCSLRPNEDKLTFAAVFELDDKAKVHNEWFGRTVIHSAHRFSYEQAQEGIESGKGKFVISHSGRYVIYQAPTTLPAGQTEMKLVFKVSCKGISGIYAAVLATGASKIDRQVGKTAVDIISNGDVYNIKNAVEEIGHLRALFQEVFYGLITAG